MARPRSGLRVVNIRQAGRLFRQAGVRTLTPQEAASQLQGTQTDSVRYVRDRFGKVIGVLDERTGQSRVPTPGDLIEANLRDPRGAERQRQVDLEIQRARNRGFSLDPQIAQQRVERGQQTIITESGQQIVVQRPDPSQRVVTVAPTASEQFAQSRQEYGQVQGTLRFVGEKAQGRFDILERRYAPQGQSLASTQVGNTGTGVISFVTQTGVYLIPYVGEGLAVAAGSEAAFDNDLTITERAVGAGAAVLGGYSGAARVGRRLGFPKIDTTFVSQEVSRVGDSTVTNTMAVSNVRNLLTSRRYLIGAQTISKLSPGDDIQRFESITAIGARPSLGTELATGREFFGSTRFGLSGSVGTIKDRIVRVGFEPFPGAKVLKELPGVESRAFTRTSMARRFGENVITERFSIGLGVEATENKILSQQISFLLKENKLTRQGRAVARGRTLIGTEDEVSSIINPSRSQKTTSFKDTFQDTILKNSIEDVIKTIERTPKPIPPSARTTPVALISTRVQAQYPTIVGGNAQKSSFQGTGQYERTLDRVTELLASGTGNRQVPRNIVLPRQTNRGGQRFTELPAQSQAAIQRSLLREEQAIQQKQVSRSANRSYFQDFIPPTLGGVPVKPGLKFRREKKRRGFGTSSAYAVLIRKRGRNVAIARDLPQGLALQALERGLLGDLARTGKIVETGTTDIQDISFRPSTRVFRQYRVRGGRRVATDPLEFIQRTEANLQNQAEKSALQRARRR